MMSRSIRQPPRFIWTLEPWNF